MKKEIFRTIKYFMISASAGLIEMGSFTLFTQLHLGPYWPRYLVALVLSVLWNFTLNRKYTFHSNNNVPLAMLKVAAYYAVFTPLSTILGQHLVDLGVNDYIVTIGNLLINGVTEYLYQRLFVFGASIDSAASKKAAAAPRA